MPNIDESDSPFFSEDILNWLNNCSEIILNPQGENALSYRLLGLHPLEEETEEEGDNMPFNNEQIYNDNTMSINYFDDEAPEYFDNSDSDDLGTDDEYGLLPYNYIPRSFEMLGRSKHDERFGIELEIDKGFNGYECVQALKRLSKHTYFVHDGSLVNGIEIVSMPATLATHKANKLIPWKEIMATAIKFGFKSHNAGTCGLHIHVSRTFFGETQEEQEVNIAKTILLVNRFWDSHIVTFTRRKTEQLNRYAKKLEILSQSEEKDALKNIAAKELITAKMKKLKTGRHEDRYYAVNIQNNNTVEFRMFRGTLKYSTFISTLEFVSELIRFAKTLSLNNIYSVQWLDIFGNTKYKNLRDYLIEKGLMHN